MNVISQYFQLITSSLLLIDLKFQRNCLSNLLEIWLLIVELYNHLNQYGKFYFHWYLEFVFGFETVKKHCIINFQRECISLHVGQAGVQIGIPVGSCIALSMELLQMARCRVDLQPARQTILSTRFSVKLVPGNTFHVRCLLTWSLLLLVSFV